MNVFNLDSQAPKNISLKMKKSPFTNKNYTQFRQDQKQFVNYPTDSEFLCNERQLRQTFIQSYLKMQPQFPDFSASLPNFHKDQWIFYAKPDQKLGQSKWI